MTKGASGLLTGLDLAVVMLNAELCLRRPVAVYPDAARTTASWFDETLEKTQ